VIPPHEQASLSDALFQASLGEFLCDACKRMQEPGSHRIFLRASWRKARDVLCRGCWLMLVQASKVGMSGYRIDQEG